MSSLDANESRKRARTEDGIAAIQDSEQSCDLERDTDVWFEDGNVILTAVGVGFRVHRGVLSAASALFRDMFSMRQTDDQEHLDGCPLIEMHDSPDELRHLLRILYSGRNYFRPDSRADFASVASTIRMAHKYQIQDLLMDAMDRLKTYYTTDLSIWQRLYGADGSSAMKRPSDAEAITAVSLARLINTQSILPIALYVCCQLDTYSLLDGTPLPDGTLACLSTEDLARCIDGRARLLQEGCRVGSQALWLDRRTPNCRSEACPRARLYAKPQEPYVTPGKEYDVFRVRGSIIAEMLGDQTQICPLCVAQMTVKHEQEIHRLWTELPNRFICKHMEAASGSKKRQRSDEGVIAETVPSRELKRDEDFWFEDGNVILENHGVGYRVHKGILSKTSTVLCDLFLVPQPRDEEQLDGCPVVHMHEQPSDVRHLMGIIYNGRRQVDRALFFEPGAHAPVDFSTVAAIVRMAHKFEIQELLKHALTRLKSWYTDDFMIWERNCGSNGTAMMRRPLSTEAIVAVLLARLTNTKTMLPLALYLCSQLPASSLLQDVHLPDGSVAQLSLDDVARCIEGKAKLIEKKITAFHSLLYQSRNANCKLKCWTKYCSCILSEKWGGTQDYHVLMPLRDQIPPYSTLLKAGVCIGCIHFVFDAEQRARRTIWRQLPKLMGVADSSLKWPAGTL
ncbi:hypothetical protein OBBRIDRAFT_839002 [Obba rivulosa]|uniref:BTB domain-containing protein n=1 Tax=Obba rivulosa TaxID=1052685 RepID=A0A8E2AL61_9APHY|nr:hypothetical protein OBBRIDRAFT_839002 [Obba rivulosa]